jgi:hypothetical protein
MQDEGIPALIAAMVSAVLIIGVVVAGSILAFVLTIGTLGVE